ncbi:MAG TPA: hypothetical protein VIJ92_13800 [Ginsengibacter sp.]
MQHKFFKTILLVAISAAVNAQTLKPWVWDTYKLKFKAPDNLVLQKSDATIYEAGNGNMFLDIYPRQGEQLTYDGMKNSIIKWAADLGLSYSDVNSDGTTQPIYLSNLNGFWGCAIDGTKNNLPATVLVIVNSSDPTLSFYIWINYKKEYYRDAVAVLQSFTPTGGSSSTATTHTTTPVKHKKKSGSATVF